MERIYESIDKQRRMWREFEVLKTQFEVMYLSEFNCFWVYLYPLGNEQSLAILKVRVNCRKNKNFAKATTYSKIYFGFNNKDFLSYKDAIIEIQKLK